MAAPAASTLHFAASSHAATGALGPIHEALDFGFTLGDARITVGSVLFAVIIVMLAALASRLLRNGLKRYAQRHASSESAMYALARVLHYLVLTIGVLLALSVANIPLSEFGLFAGALGVGLGFGLQAIFSNFISGLIILFDRSIKVGDFIQLPNGSHGVVRDIHIRATRITTTDNIDILIPNSKFITDNVVNLTWRDTARRSHIAFRVPYGSDKEVVRRAVLEAAAQVPFALTGDDTRKPQLWVTGFGESALECAMVVWLNAGAAQRYRGVMAAYTWALHDALEKYHLALPYPQRDLHVKSWPAQPFPTGDNDAGKLPVDRRHAGAASARSTEHSGPSPTPDAAPSHNDAADSVANELARAEAARGDDEPAGTSADPTPSKENPPHGQRD